MTYEDPEENDHDLDYPWTLYFNGEPMPRWSNCWSLCDLLQYAVESCEEHSCSSSHGNFRHLLDRMDPAHTFESEDRDVFRICCLTLLVLLLRHKSSVLEKLASYEPDDSSIVEDIYAGVRDGLIAMHALTLRDGIAFWSVGYHADYERLTEAIKRSQLPSTHQDYLEPPHLKTRREEVTSRLRDLRGSLLEIVATDHLSKDIRRFIHQLPTKIQP